MRDIKIFTILGLLVSTFAFAEDKKITQFDLSGYWKVVQLSQYKKENNLQKIIHTEKLQIKSILRLLPDGRVRVNEQDAVNWKVDSLVKKKNSRMLILTTFFNDQKGSEITEKLFLKPISLVKKNKDNLVVESVKNDLITQDEHIEMTLRKALDLRNPRQPVLATNFRGKLIIKNGIIEEMFISVSGKSILVENVDINTNSAIHNGYSILIRPFRGKKEYVVNLIGGPLDRMKLVFWDNNKIEEVNNIERSEVDERLASSSLSYEQENAELEDKKSQLQIKEEEAILARKESAMSIEEKIIRDGVVF